MRVHVQQQAACLCRQEKTCPADTQLLLACVITVIIIIIIIILIITIVVVIVNVIDIFLVMLMHLAV